MMLQPGLRQALNGRRRGRGCFDSSERDRHPRMLLLLDCSLGLAVPRWLPSEQKRFWGGVIVT